MFFGTKISFLVFAIGLLNSYIVHFIEKKCCLNNFICENVVASIMFA